MYYSPGQRRTSPQSGSDTSHASLVSPGYTPRKLVRHALNMMTGFSTRPLQLASLMGFAFALFGFLILAYVLIRWLLQGSTVPGFAFLASIIAIFSGAQLIALGIIGEYLARIHSRTIVKRHQELTPWRHEQLTPWVCLVSVLEG